MSAMNANPRWIVCNVCVCVCMCAYVCVYTHNMFDGVVHDDIILPYWQPGTQCDDITVMKRFWTLPCKLQR